MTTESPMMTSKMMVTPINSKGVIVIFSLNDMSHCLAISQAPKSPTMIGLSLSRQIMRVSGGSLSLHQDKAQGITTFRIIIP
jgi:hypothetical protein